MTRRWMKSQFHISSRKPGKRIYHYCPGKRSARLGRRALRLGLPALSAFFLLLFLFSVIPSVQTARRNETYAVWREKARQGTKESEAVSIPDAPQLARMGMPDGTPITRMSNASKDQPASVSLSGNQYHTLTGTKLPEMRQLLTKNRDLVAWLTIDQVLDLPVVYRDNQFYLNHDFEGNQSAAGTLFLDESHPLAEKAQTLLIHGHNMKDGSMFGHLTHYQKSAWWKKHPFIRLTTLWEEEEYVVFAVVKISADSSGSIVSGGIRQAAFASEAQFARFISQVKSCSLIPSGLSVEPGDALLKLSTCLGEDRLIVLARRFRTGETSAGLLRIVQAL